MLKKKLQSIKEKMMVYWRNTDRHYLGEWIVLGGVLLFCLLTMCYKDIISTNYDTNYFLNYIFSDKCLRVREILLACPYGVSFFIVYGIGFFPVWLIGKFGAGDIICESIGCLIWMKMFLCIITIGMLIQVRRIAYIIGIRKENIKWLLFAISSSLFVVLPVFQIAQYDVIALFFIVLGIRLYLEGHNKLFLLTFSFAVPMKYFAIFIFVPIVLYKTKKIWKVILELLAGAGVLLFERVIIGNLFLKIADLFQASRTVVSEVLVASNELSGGMLEQQADVVSSYGDQFVSGQLGYLMHNEITIGNFNASLFFLAWAVVCVWAFVKKTALDGKNQGRDIITLGLFTYMGFFLTFYSWNSYWIILLAPFLVIYVFMHEENLRNNLIFEMVITLGFVIGETIHESWVFGGQYSFSYLIMRDTNPRLMNVYYLVEKYKIAKYYPAIFAIVLVCIGALLIINQRSKKAEISENIVTTGNNVTSVGRGFWWLRLFIVIAFTFAIVYCNYLA